MDYNPVENPGISTFSWESHEKQHHNLSGNIFNGIRLPNYQSSLSAEMLFNCF